MWINREAEQELRRWAEHWLADDSQDIDELLDSMHVIDADAEAEAALERVYARHMALFAVEVGRALDGAPAEEHEGSTFSEKDYATIRARLRAAKASHTPEIGEASKYKNEGLLAFHDLVRERNSIAPHVFQNICHLQSAFSRLCGIILPPRPEPAAKPKETQE